MTYVTPARNEADFIERTIQSVIHQTIRPLRWMIVSDGSTDLTDEIVKEYVRQYPWIELIRMPDRPGRHFGGKAIAFNAGHDRIRSLDFSFIGNLDADIIVSPDHFEFLLNKFVQDETLGVAGTPFRQGDSQYDYRFSGKEHVSGACQLFRRECFDAVGGYIPHEGGGIDLTAVVTARMLGWKTETFTEKACRHLRPMGKAGSNYFKYAFRSGYDDYLLRLHPLWQLFRSIYQMISYPPIISGFLHLSGYCWGHITKPDKPGSWEFVRFRRKEQVLWLKEYARKLLACLE